MDLPDSYSLALIDFELPLLKQTADLCDQMMEQLDRKAASSENPDQFGIYDRWEYVVGLGFVGCQRYFDATCNGRGVAKANALAMGPVHRSGQTFVAIMNAAANHWKHHSEDALRPTDGAARQRRAIFAKLGVDPDSSYATANLLFALTSPGQARIGRLLPFLMQWSAVAASPT
jgi:hypothetical protein